MVMNEQIAEEDLLVKQISQELREPEYTIARSVDLYWYNWRVII